ncbi:MAG: hypothetical protein AB7O97_18235 [Planctomycetota bacterium]
MKSNDRAFRPGFRMSAQDALVLAASGTATAMLWPGHRPLAIAVAFVVLHFFLFCNVVRMARRLELVWAAACLALLGASLGFGLLELARALWLTSMGTVALAFVQLRRPDYHGVGWRRINPGLTAWWAARQQARS